MIADFDIDEFVSRVLAEDLGKGGDVTSKATIAADARFSAQLSARQPIVVAGLAVAEAFFRALDGEVEIERLAADGNRVETSAALMKITGNARSMLAAERSALNTLQHLSGIATLTRRYVDAIEGTGATLLDTRKTIPGLRLLDKYAARMGGAHNHRMRLDDGVLIKDNHVAVAGGVAAAVTAAKSAQTGLQVQVEVELDRADRTGAGGRSRPAASRQHGPADAPRGGRSGRWPGSAGSIGRGDAGNDPRDRPNRGRLYLRRADHAVGSGCRRRHGLCAARKLTAQFSTGS